MDDWNVEDTNDWNTVDENAWNVENASDRDEKRLDVSQRRERAEIVRVSEPSAKTCARQRQQNTNGEKIAEHERNLNVKKVCTTVQSSRINNRDQQEVELESETQKDAEGLSIAEGVSVGVYLISWIILGNKLATELGGLFGKPINDWLAAMLEILPLLFAGAAGSALVSADKKSIKEYVEIFAISILSEVIPICLLVVLFAVVYFFG